MARHTSFPPNPRYGEDDDTCELEAALAAEYELRTVALHKQEDAYFEKLRKRAEKKERSRELRGRRE